MCLEGASKVPEILGKTILAPEKSLPEIEDKVSDGT